MGNTPLPQYNCALSDPLLHYNYNPCAGKRAHTDSDCLTYTYIYRSMLHRACPMETLEVLLTLQTL